MPVLNGAMAVVHKYHNTYIIVCISAVYSTVVSMPFQHVQRNWNIHQAAGKAVATPSRPVQKKHGREVYSVVAVEIQLLWQASQGRNEGGSFRCPPTNQTTPTRRTLYSSQCSKRLPFFRYRAPASCRYVSRTPWWAFHSCGGGAVSEMPGFRDIATP